MSDNKRENINMNNLDAMLASIYREAILTLAQDIEGDKQKAVEIALEHLSNAAKKFDYPVSFNDESITLER